MMLNLMALKINRLQILDMIDVLIIQYLILVLKRIIFFFLKPFVGFEYTGDSAYYFLTGIYLEDNLGATFRWKRK